MLTVYGSRLPLRVAGVERAPCSGRGVIEAAGVVAKLDDVGSNPVAVPPERALTCADVDQRRPCGRGERTASAGR